jgi:hypothetical protein|tara:strand:+ start:11 stop:193 length:183 start_codon:yes stop_codon:yes gene_type:complete
MSHIELHNLASLKNRTNIAENRTSIQEILRVWELRNPTTYNENTTKINEIKTTFSIKVEE